MVNVIQTFSMHMLVLCQKEPKRIKKSLFSDQCLISDREICEIPYSLKIQHLQPQEVLKQRFYVNDIKCLLAFLYASSPSNVCLHRVDQI